MSHKTKKRIRNKHHHHEEHLRESIREEVLEEFVEQEQRLLAREQKLLDRIDYLVGANNEAFDMLRKTEEELKKYTGAANVVTIGDQLDQIVEEAEEEERQRKETASEALMNDPF
tara:strand:- start:57 stop:401 length:345 start_codon:yes stop_codon:yes gene_type:complete